MNEWRNEESCMRGQQTCPLTIHFKMWTVSSDVSIQRRPWPPLSVHLLAYYTHPTHDANDVMCEGWPQHRGLRLLLFSNSGVGSFTSHKNQISVSAGRRNLRFFVLMQKTRKSNCLQISLQRQHFLLSYLKTLSVGLAGGRTRDLSLSSPALFQLSRPGGGIILLKKCQKVQAIFWAYFENYNTETRFFNEPCSHLSYADNVSSPLELLKKEEFNTKLYLKAPMNHLSKKHFSVGLFF